MQWKTLFLLIFGSFFRAAGASGDTVTVAPGKMLCVRLGSKAKMKIGAGVSGVLAETVYVRDQIAIPAGTRLIGHVADIVDGPTLKHVKSIMDGDFTPPHDALVQFDYVVAADGTWLAVHTKTSQGLSNGTEVTYSEEGDKSTPDPKHDREIKQHIEDALEHKLPYHPEHVARGDVFHCELSDALELVSQGTALPRKDALLTVQLLTALDTKSAELNAPVQAIVSEPYFSPEGALLFPEGTRIAGRITDAYSAGMLQHQGRLRLHMDTAQIASGAVLSVNGEVAGVESSRGDHMRVGGEGDVSTARSKIGMGKAVFSVYGPARSAEDPDAAKTGYSRATRGLSGFGVLGSAVAQAGPNTATGFGAYGAAKALYWTFIGPGKNVVLPIGTRVRLRLERVPESH